MQIIHNNIIILNIYIYIIDLTNILIKPGFASILGEGAEVTVMCAQHVKKLEPEVTTLIISRVHRLLIVSLPFLAHILRAHGCHGKIWSGFARLRSKIEEENSFIASFSTVFANS